MLVYESGCSDCESQLGCAGAACSRYRLPVRVCDRCGTPLLGAAPNAVSPRRAPMRRDFRREGEIYEDFEDNEDFEEYAEIEENEERRNTDGEHPPFSERVISRSNEYISGGELSRNYERKELCERCGAVKKSSAVRRSQPRR